MAKQRQENPSHESSTSPTKSKVGKPAKAKQIKKRVANDLPWHLAWRWLVSLLVVLHLAAVFCAPWDLLTQETLPPGSVPLRFMDPADIQQIPPGVIQTPLVTRSLHRFFHDYLNLLYLNHGYEFFAPDPAGTHVIDYEVTQTDGNVVAGRFPSLDEQWPRLFYHRHMMLAEQTQLMPGDSATHYAQHLANLHQGTSRVELKVHLLLPPERIANQTPLDDPSTYQSIGVVTGQPQRTVSPAPQDFQKQGALQ